MDEYRSPLAEDLLPQLTSIFFSAGFEASSVHAGVVKPETIPLAVGRTMATTLTLSAAAIKQRLYFRELRDAFTAGWRDHERTLPVTTIRARYAEEPSSGQLLPSDATVDHFIQ